MVGEGRDRIEGGCLSARIEHTEGPTEMLLVITPVVPRRVFQAPRMETTIMGDPTQRIEENVPTCQYSL